MDLDGEVIEGYQLSIKHKHSLVRKLHTSREISEEDKKKALQELSEMDKSDWLEKTSYFSRAALPDLATKRDLWRQYFDEDLEWSYHNFVMSFRGFNIISQRDILVEFEDKFFERILDGFKKKGRFVAEAMYRFLSPEVNGTAEVVEKFKLLLAKV